MEKEKEKMQDQLKEDAGIADRQEDPEEGESLDIKNSPGTAGDEAEAEKEASATAQAGSDVDDVSETVPEETAGQSQPGDIGRIIRTDTNKPYWRRGRERRTHSGQQIREDPQGLASQNAEDPEEEPEAIDPKPLLSS